MSLLRIGDLARLGGVSVRMLRHYHEIGLLTPDVVDETTGYRFYNGEQLETLRRIVGLKDLGLSLAETRQIVQGQATEREIRQILLARRAAAEVELRTARATVEHIDAHLAALAEADDEPETRTPTKKDEGDVIEVEIKPVEPRLVAQLSAVAESWAPTDIGPVIQPLYPELIARMGEAEVEITGPSTAWYEDTPEGRVLVHATLTIGEAPKAPAEALGFEVTELPAMAKVASTVHRGTMDNADTTYEALLEWIEQHGYRPLGYSREIDIECRPDRTWITELQIPIEAASIKAMENAK